MMSKGDTVRTLTCAVAVLCVIAAGAAVGAQERGRGGRGAGGAGQRGSGPATPRALAPVDLTGYWVSVITEDWEFRMVTPPKGVFGGLGSIPLNAEAKKVASTWDPAADEAAGEQCKAYGAAAIMRVPGRLHITWESDTTLRIDTDAGTQTRRLQFNASAPAPGERSWQGYSIAQWEGAGGRRGAGGAASGGGLKVITTHLRPGYLRKNGVPYGESAIMTEYFNLYTAPNGDTWLVVATIVDDSQYLSQPFVTTSNFKKLPDATGWSPTPCERPVKAP